MIMLMTIPSWLECIMKSNKKDRYKKAKEQNPSFGFYRPSIIPTGKAKMDTRQRKKQQIRKEIEEV